MSEPHHKQLRDSILEAYQREHPDKPFAKIDAALWAIKNKLWDTPMKTKVQMLCDELGTALGTTRINVNSRKIRQYHCIQLPLESGGKQNLWSHLDIATPEFLEQSIARRRRSLRNQNIQLHNDAVYMNAAKGTHIQLLLDYTDDIADYEHALSEKQNLSEHEDLSDPEK